MSKVLRFIPIISSFVPPPPPEELKLPSIRFTEAPSAPAPGDVAEEKKAEQAAEEEREKQRKKAGRKSTILTSPIGASSFKPGEVFRKTLLGG